ncbi:MAG: T9SS type A sorting domain-containing protein [Flavobacteriales bacterium]|nr:T9SS type A sorting domain-containing protein [Flavobacteriales bacterium]
MDTSACQLVHVGIEDLNGAIETTIYPNPTNDELNIAHEGTFNYTVINVIGEVILEGTANNKIQLSLKEFEAGTYTIKVTADQKTEVVKAIKY